MDDSTRQAIRAQLDPMIETMLDEVAEATLDLGAREQRVWRWMRDMGCRVLEVSLAADGRHVAGCARCGRCAEPARFEGYRSKGVQTVLGWVALSRAYYRCSSCGWSGLPFDGVLGLARDSHSPTVRQHISEFGAQMSFAAAADMLRRTTGIAVSVSTVRAVTNHVGTRREAELTAAVETAWAAGLPSPTEPGPDRLYVAMDGVQILATTGGDKEVKVGVVRAERHGVDGWRRDPAHYVASLAGAAAFGERVALTAHAQGVESAGEVIVLGDGAEWIWHLAAEHCPQATTIVDWYHAAERIWTLGRALYGEHPSRMTRWVERQLALLAQGEVARLVRNWRRRCCSGGAATVRNEQVTYFTNQAGRMAYDQYRARGLDIGSGMVESACKHLIGARHKGPGMRWSEPGAQAVANLRVLLFNDEWETYWPTDSSAA
jgi:hypothetical protein